MGEEGFWDDSERAAAVSAEHSRAARRLETFRALQSDVEDLDGLAEMAAEEESLQGELDEQIASVEARLAALRSSGCSRALRLRRRARHGECGRGRDRRAGLGGDGAADGDALGRAPRLQGRAAGGERRGGSGDQVRHLPRLGRERLRAVRRRAGRAPARAPLSVRLRPPPPHELRRGRGRAGGKDTGEIEINEDDLQVDTYRASGAGGQHVNKTDSAVRITHRPTGIVVQCQNERSQSSNRATAMAMLRAKLLERRERERQEEIAREKGEAQDVNFGSQIRSYVLHPYTMVKDHRTGHEMGDVQRVLDGDLDGFVRAYLLAAASSGG